MFHSFSGTKTVYRNVWYPRVTTRFMQKKKLCQGYLRKKSLLMEEKKGSPNRLCHILKYLKFFISSRWCTSLKASLKQLASEEKKEFVRLAHSALASIVIAYYLLVNQCLGC